MLLGDLRLAFHTSLDRQTLPRHSSGFVFALQLLSHVPHITSLEQAIFFFYFPFHFLPLFFYPFSFLSILLPLPLITFSLSTYLYSFFHSISSLFSSFPLFFISPSLHFLFSLLLFFFVFSFLYFTFFSLFPSPILLFRRKQLPPVMSFFHCSAFS